MQIRGKSKYQQALILSSINKDAPPARKAATERFQVTGTARKNPSIMCHLDCSFSSTEYMHIGHTHARVPPRRVARQKGSSQQCIFKSVCQNKQTTKTLAIQCQKYLPIALAFKGLQQGKNVTTRDTERGHAQLTFSRHVPVLPELLQRQHPQLHPPISSW